MFSYNRDMIPINSPILLYGLALITAILILLNFFIRSFRRDPRLVKFAKTLPGPRGIPFLGNYADFYYGEDSLKTMIDFLHKYGHVYRLWFGRHLVVGLSNVEDLERVFLSSKMLAKPRIFHPYHDIWGDGLFTAPVDIWKKNRKKFYPAFANTRFDIYTAQINDVTRHAINKMRNSIDEDEFSAWDFFVYLSFKVITKTMLNAETDLWDHESITQFHRNLSKVQQVSFKRMCVPWFQIKFVDELFHRRQLDDITDKIFKFSKKALNEQKNVSNYSSLHDKEQGMKYATESSKSFREILLDLLNEECNDKIVCDEIYTVISGGTNTNASVISFFLIAIAIHQDIQDKLYDEIYQVFGDSDRDANQDDIKRLPYFDQVLKESLRRFTIAPFLFREVQNDSKIGDRMFPAGTAILISIGAVHFNPEYYPNPMNFNPDHFSPEAVKKRHKLTFLPFSAAARNCIGQNFAMLEFKLILTSLLRNFSFHSTMTMEDIKLNMGSVIHSTNNLNLSIKPRIKK